MVRYHVNERWLGGMLTNFRTIQSRIARLHAIETMSQDGTSIPPPRAGYSVKERMGEAGEELGRYQEHDQSSRCYLRCRSQEGERICVQEVM